LLLSTYLYCDTTAFLECIPVYRLNYVPEILVKLAVASPESPLYFELKNGDKNEQE
jgi:hypothetical protein